MVRLAGGAENEASRLHRRPFPAQAEKHGRLKMQEYGVLRALRPPQDKARLLGPAMAYAHDLHGAPSLARTVRAASRTGGFYCSGNDRKCQYFDTFFYCDKRETAL